MKVWTNTSTDRRFFEQVCLHLELYSSRVAKRATQLEQQYLLAVKTAANVYIYYRVNF